MESGSAMTRSFRPMISFERGPGIAVLSSMVFVVATRLTIPQSAAVLHTCIGVLQRSSRLAKSRRGQRLDGVDAGRVPEHEALGVFEPGGLDLVLNVAERVRAAQREVLQPRDQRGRPASQGRPEIAQ